MSLEELEIRAKGGDAEKRKPGKGNTGVAAIPKGCVEDKKKINTILKRCGVKPSANKKPSVGNKKPSSGKKKPSGGNKKPSSGNKKPSGGSKKPSGGNKKPSKKVDKKPKI